MRDNENNALLAREVPVPGPQVEEYKPSDAECLRDYEITIKFLHRGCIVSVGCKAIAFESVDSAMLEINNYVANPYEAQKKWRKIVG